MKAALLCALLAPSQAYLVGPPTLVQQHRLAATSAAARVPVVHAVERSGDVGVLRRVAGGLRKALFLGVAGVLVRSPVAPQAIAVKAPTAATKEVKTNGLPTLATIAMGGGLVYWSVKEANEEDEEEKIRVKEETEKLESMQKEYTDIDEGVTVDEDLFASLAARINSTETIEGNEDSPLGGFDEGLPPPSPPVPDMPSSGGGSAVLEPPSATPEPPQDEPSPGASAEDIERLKVRRATARARSQHEPPAPGSSQCPSHYSST